MYKCIAFIQIHLDPQNGGTRCYKPQNKAQNVAKDFIWAHQIKQTEKTLLYWITESQTKNKEGNTFNFQGFPTQ